MVKANAYGHGMVFVSSVIEEIVDCFGVARLEEALKLRSNGITKPILLLEGFFAEKDLSILAENNIQTIVHNREQLTALRQTSVPNKIKVWLKIDTGCTVWACARIKLMTFTKPSKIAQISIARLDLSAILVAPTSWIRIIPKNN